MRREKTEMGDKGRLKETTRPRGNMGMENSKTCSRKSTSGSDLMEYILVE